MSPEEMAEVAHTPPIPLDHGILLELHKELVKEYDNGTEGAVARWLEQWLHTKIIPVVIRYRTRHSILKSHRRTNHVRLKRWVYTRR